VQFFYGTVIALLTVAFIVLFSLTGWCGGDIPVLPVSSILKITENGNSVKVDLGILMEAMQIASSYHVDRKSLDKDKMVGGMIRGFLMYINDAQRKSLLVAAKNCPYKPTDCKDQLIFRVVADDGFVLRVDAGYFLWTLKLAVREGLLKKKRNGPGLAECLAMGFVRSLDRHSDFLDPEEAKDYIKSFELGNTVSVRSLGDKSNKVYIVYIVEFARNTAREFKKLTKELSREKNARVIFDLRDNPGGLDIPTEEILGYLVGANKVLLSEKDYSGVEVFKRTPIDSGAGIANKWKIVCLVDNGTASNAEVFSACLRDNLGAKLIGTTTYGKGVGGTLYDLRSGRGSCRITYTRWYTPCGKCIQDVGLLPDIEVGDELGQMNRAIQELLK